MYCSGGQSYCVGLWLGHRYKEPVLQATHAVWSLGAAIGPLIIGCFLVDLPPKDIAKDVNWTSESSVSVAAGIIGQLPKLCVKIRILMPRIFNVYFVGAFF